MTFSPAPLTALGRYWVSKGGVNLGVVGDTAHQAKGTSYHLGRSQLTATAYSRTTARDRAGLSEAASAIDLGKLGRLGYPGLRKFSEWFAKECMARKPAYRDVREVIFTIDGRTVVGWSDLAPLKLITGYGDSSHLYHTHISFYRDSETRDKVAMFAPYFTGTAPGPEEGPVRAFDVVTTLPVGTVTVMEATGAYYLNMTTDKLEGPIANGVRAGSTIGQPVRLREPVPARQATDTDDWKLGFIVGDRTGNPSFFLSRNVTVTPATAPASPLPATIDVGGTIYRR